LGAEVGHLHSWDEHENPYHRGFRPDLALMV